jgi:hypothetical protein
MITDQQKTKINELISLIEGTISRIEKGVVRGQEAGDFFAEQIRAAKELFVNTSDEWRIIDRWEYESGFQWHPVYKSGSYAGDGEKEKFSKLLNVLNDLLPQGSVVVAKKEHYFSVIQTYEAKQFICSLFRSAGGKLIVVDEHLDDQFFEYVDIVPDTVQVQIITGEQKPIFWTLLSELKKKRQNIEARVNVTSHCRYIVVDDSVIYSTDASLNTIGKKDFMIHRLEDDKEIAKVKSEIENYWNSAKIK